MVFALVGRRRQLALHNVAIAFPDMSPSDRKALVRRAYINLSESMALNTLIMADRITNEQILQMVETEGWETLIEQSSDKGLLVITAHMGNWELMPQYAALRLDKQVHVVTREGNNRLLEEKVVRPLRERFGVDVFYKKNALMRIVKAIKKGGICGLLIDQKLRQRSSGSMPIEFFGRSAPSTSASALLQIRFGITVLPAFMVKTAPGKYRMIASEPVQWTDNGKPMEEQVADLTAIHQRILEDVIRQYPDQWFWMHNRWDLTKAEQCKKP